MSIPNPVAGVAQVNQVLLCIAVTILLLLAWRYKNRIIFLFTGDDRIHAGSLDIFWYWCCRCGGCCDGEWTRRVFGRNLKKELGRYAGCVSFPIEVRNMVAGDLPFHGHGDFYLTVECGDNPPMSTSVAENCSPKVVHFNEILTLRVRDSILENQVRFVVKELNVFGSQEVADLRLSAPRVCDWLRDSKDQGSGIMRFQMDPCDRASDIDTPAWLAMEFAAAPEFHGRQGYSYVHLFDTQTGVFEKPISSKQFKTNYRLVDRTGERQTEPDDDMIEEIAASRRAKKDAACCMVTLVVLIIVAAVLFRLFLWKCWHEFMDLTIQTGVPNPDHEAVMAVCDNPPMGVHPRVFERLAKEYNIPSVPCFKGVCHVRDQFVEYRVAFFAFLAILCLAVLYLLARPPAAQSRRGRIRASAGDDDESPRKNKRGHESPHH